MENMLLRSEFLAEVNARGVNLSERNLRGWERHQLIPHPVRRWYQGAVRALYSPDLVHRAVRIRTLLDAGFTRQQIVLILNGNQELVPHRRRRARIEGGITKAIRAHGSDVAMALVIYDEHGSVIEEIEV